ncbi:unnamed protein product [Ophioblennius macclurei]
MFLCWTRRLHDSAPMASACFRAAFLLLLARCCEGQYQVVGPSAPVLAMLGSEVVLPCRLEPAADETKGTVEWSRSDLDPRFVYLRQDGVDLLVYQHRSYSGRTRLSSSGLKHGDVSLRLSDVKLSDEGTYRCFVPRKISLEVHLQVGAAPPSVAISAVLDKSHSEVTLGCRSVGWYPKPELLWLDSDGNLLPARPPETLRGPDGLYAISSRVTMGIRSSTNVSCLVQQGSQSRAAGFSFTAEVLKEESGSFARTGIVLASTVCFIASFSGLLVFWKLKPNEIRDEKVKEDEEAQLVKRSREMEVLDRELRRRQGEDEDLDDVIRSLETWEKELKEAKSLQTVQLDAVEKKITEREKKHRKSFNVRDPYLKDDHLEEKAELERELTDLKESFWPMDSIQENLEETISIIRNRRERVGRKIQKLHEQIESANSREGNC